MRKIIGISTVLISLFLFSCQDDDIGKVETNSNESKKLNIWRFPVEQVLKHKPNIKKQLDNLKTLKTQAKLTSSTYEFSIEETDAQVIFDDNYTQYTFKVQRENPNDNVLENYICKVFNNGEVQQFLISYPYIENENGIVYDTQNITMQPITDNSLIINSLNARIGCVPEFVSVFETYECENVPCSGGGSSGTHNVGDDCECGVTVNCIPAHTECNWVTTVVWGYNCPNGGIDGSTNDGSDLPQGGNSSTDNTTNPDDEIVTVPFDDTRAKAKECEKISNLLNFETNANTNETYRDKIVNLATQVNDTLNEKGLYLNSNNLVGYPNPGFTVKFLKSISYKAMSHTHNDDPEGKYSVFSFNDLISISELLNLNKINSTEFVATLSTSKGTHFALTISDVTKFKAFFYSHNNDAGSAGFNYWKTNWENLERINEKYYNGKTPLIKQNDTDNEAVLEHFLDMMNEADLGISLYKTNANFDSYTRVIKDKTTGEIKEDTCN
jgi:hypothetical protein